MYIVDLSNPLVTKYNFSVMKNNNVDVVHIFSNLVQYASYLCYLKVESSDGTYVDEFLIDSNDIIVEENALMVKWTMGAVSTQCKKINIQLEFRENTNEDSKVAQSGIVSIILGDTIDVEGEVEHIYPHILKELQDQIDELKVEKGSKLYTHDIQYHASQYTIRHLVFLSNRATPYTFDDFTLVSNNNLIIADLKKYPRVQGNAVPTTWIGLILKWVDGANHVVIIETTINGQSTAESRADLVYSFDGDTVTEL